MSQLTRDILTAVAFGLVVVGVVLVFSAVLA
jgi:hypothetical protein